MHHSPCVGNDFLVVIIQRTHNGNLELAQDHSERRLEADRGNPPDLGGRSSLVVDVFVNLQKKVSAVHHELNSVL